MLLLEVPILIDCSGVEHHALGLLHAVVANRVEVGLSIGQQGDVDLAGADLLVAA